MCCGCTHRRITASLITASLLTFLARLGLLKASRSHGVGVSHVSHVRVMLMIHGFMHHVILSWTYHVMKCSFSVSSLASLRQRQHGHAASRRRNRRTRTTTIIGSNQQSSTSMESMESLAYHDYHDHVLWLESFTTMHIYMRHVIDCESVIRDAGW